MSFIELKDRCLKTYDDESNRSRSDQVDPNEQTLIICHNFRREEIKDIILNQLGVNLMIYYEIILRSPTDKSMDFNGEGDFLNIIIPGDMENSKDINICIVRKGKLAFVFIQN